MNSGVTPPDRKDVRLANQMAMGMKKFAGSANVLSMRHLKVQHVNKANNIIIMPQTLALSVLIFELTGKSAAQIF